MVVRFPNLLWKSTLCGEPEYGDGDGDGILDNYKVV